MMFKLMLGSSKGLNYELSVYLNYLIAAELTQTIYLEFEIEK